MKDKIAEVIRIIFEVLFVTIPLWGIPFVALVMWLVRTFIDPTITF